MHPPFKKIFVLFFCFLFTNSLFSQEKKTNPYFEDTLNKQTVKFNKQTNFRKAKTFFLEKKWDSTLVYSMKQLNTSKNTKELKNFCFLFRALSFSETNLFNESKKEFLKISKDFYFYYLVKMNLGRIALEQKEYKKAIKYFKAIEHYSKQQLRTITPIEIEQNIGTSYLLLGDFINAERYFLKCKLIEEQDKDTVGMVEIYGNIGTLYYEQYRDELAIEYYKKAYLLSKKTKKFYTKQNAAFNMSIVEENREDFAAALKYQKEYQIWKDSLNDQNKIWEVAELEKQFAIKEKQKQVSLLQAENEIKKAERNSLFYSAIILLLLLGTALYFFREKVKTNKIIVSQKEDLDTLNATKDKLFSIVSHDLRSSVNALKTSNTKLLDNLNSKNLEALQQLLQNNSAIVNGAYNLLDNLLHWALLQTKQSYFEITKMRLFFIIEQIAYNYKPFLLDKNIDFENTISKNAFVYADQESLKIIVRNLLDNAIKFTPEQGSIKIYNTDSDDEYCGFVIEDSGLGMNETTRLELLKDTLLLSKKGNENSIGTGLGMQLCKSMLQKNQGKLAIESELGNGTKMIVYLPKIQKNG